MPATAPIDRRLPENADLVNLKKRAKQLLKLARSGDLDALARLQNNSPRKIHTSDFATLKLSYVQLVIAREYGFASWPKLIATLESGEHVAVSDELDGAPNVVPLVPLRDYIIYPGMEMPLYVGRSKSLNAIEVAGHDQQIFLCLQKDGKKNDPDVDDVFQIGTLVTINHHNATSDGAQVFVQGHARARSLSMDFSGSYARARVEVLGVRSQQSAGEKIKKARSMFVRTVDRLSLPIELKGAIEAASEPGFLADLAAQHIPISLDKRQELLELVNPEQRLDRAVQIFAALLAELEQPPFDDFVGRYQLAPSFVVAIERGEGCLVAESPWDKVEVFPRGEDEFSPSAPIDPGGNIEPVPLYLAMAQVKPTPTFKFQRDDEGTVVAVSRNDGFSVWPAGRKIVNLEQPVPVTQETTDDLHRYSGRYEIGTGILADVSVVADRLFLDSHRLQPISDTEFFGESEPMRVWFKLNEAKHVIGMWVGNPHAHRQYWKIA